MKKLSKKYERLIEQDDKAFKRKFGKKKRKNQKTATKPFIPYKIQLLDKRWKRKREQVLKAKGNKCEICGNTKNLHVHHKKYIKDKYAWEYKMKDLAVLCGSCHKKAHGIDLDERLDILLSKEH